MKQIFECKKNDVLIVKAEVFFLNTKELNMELVRFTNIILLKTRLTMKIETLKQSEDCFENIKNNKPLIEFQDSENALYTINYKVLGEQNEKL